MPLAEGKFVNPSLQWLPICIRFRLLISYQFTAVMAFQGQSWKFAGPVYSRSISKSSQPVQDCDVCLNLQLESSGNDDDRLVRVDYYRLAERGVYEDCPYCSLIYFSLGQHGASIPETGYSIVSISAAKDQPIFLCWDDARKGRSYLEIYRAEGF